MKYGVDVSEWQSGVAWEKLHPDFVLIRAGHGLEHDTDVGINIRKAKKLNVPWGVYWCHETGCRGETEAAAALTMWTENNYPTLGIWFDVEPNAKQPAAGEAAAAFCKEVESAGYYAGVYGSGWVLDSMPIDAWDRWEASWGPNNGEPDWHEKPDTGTLWQYTSNLVIDGNRVDGDICMYDDMSFYDQKKWELKLTLEQRLIKLRSELDAIIKEVKETIK